MTKCVSCVCRKPVVAYRRCQQCADSYTANVPLHRRTYKPDGSWTHYGWQAYGRYTDVPAAAFPDRDIREPWFATWVRASNEYMAQWRILSGGSLHPYAPIIDSLKQDARP